MDWKNLEEYREYIDVYNVSGRRLILVEERGKDSGCALLRKQTIKVF